MISKRKRARFWCGNWCKERWIMMDTKERGNWSSRTLKIVPILWTWKSFNCIGSWNSWVEKNFRKKSLVKSKTIYRLKILVEKFYCWRKFPTLSSLIIFLKASNTSWILKFDSYRAVKFIRCDGCSDEEEEKKAKAKDRRNYTILIDSYIKGDKLLAGEIHLGGVRRYTITLWLNDYFITAFSRDNVQNEKKVRIRLGDIAVLTKWNKGGLIPNNKREANSILAWERVRMKASFSFYC